jgi:hypothetical protein
MHKQVAGRNRPIVIKVNETILQFQVERISEVNKPKYKKYATEILIADFEKQHSYYLENIDDNLW